MSRSVTRETQRAIQSRASLISAAALFYLSGALDTEAQPATDEPPPPVEPPTVEQPAPQPAPADTKADVPLPTVSVQADRPRPPRRQQAAQPARQAPPAPPTPPAAPTDAQGTAATAGTAGTGGYRATSPSLTRLPTSILDTPQTINVVTQQVIQEQVSATVRDALRNVAGVTFRAGEGGNQGDTPYIRGFSAQSDIFRDGVRDPGWYTRDTFAIDAVEVYKGPAAVLFGRGSTGGVINLVSKTPMERNIVEGTVTGNTGPGVRATLDANGKAADNLWMRVVTMGQLYDIAGSNHIEQNRYGVSPSLLWKPTERTKVTLAYIYQHDNNIPDYGIPFLSPAWGLPRSVAPVNRGNWYGILSSPLPDTEQVDAHIGTVKIEHEFNNQLKVSNITRYNYVDRLQRNVFPEPNTAAAGFPQPPNLNSIWTPNRAQVFVTNSQLANQTDLLAKFATGNVEHTMTAGLDATRETRNFLRNQFAGQAGTSFLDPDPWRFGGIPQPPTATQLTYGVATDVGVYIADQAKINQYFELLGSIRYDQYRFAQDAPLALAGIRRLERADEMTSWRYGAVFHPTEKSSIYVMRGTSFNPSADNLTLSVASIPAALSLLATPPEQTTTSEVGAKAEVLDGKLLVQTAFFDTYKANLRVTNASTMVTSNAGTVRARGWEASAAGKLTNEWSLIASYTYVRARFTNAVVPIQQDAEPMNTPTHAFSLWTTYDITKQLQVGGGAFYNSAVWGDLQTTGPRANTALAPAWWRFDAMAAYKITPKVTLQFNIYNLTDELYYEGVYSNWGVPAASRTFALTLRGHT